MKFTANGFQEETNIVKKANKTNINNYHVNFNNAFKKYLSHKMLNAITIQYLKKTNLFMRRKRLMFLPEPLGLRREGKASG